MNKNARLHANVRTHQGFSWVIFEANKIQQFWTVFLIKYLAYDLTSRDIFQRHFCVKKFWAPDGENFEISSDVEDKSGFVTFSGFFGVERIRYRVALQSF